MYGNGGHDTWHSPKTKINFIVAASLFDWYNKSGNLIL
jgi:hypothetical protein